MASIYDSLVSGTMGLVKGLPEHLQDTEKLAQLGLPAEDYNVISAMNAADNMNAGLGSLIAPGALYTLGDTIANPNQGLVEGVQDFGRYMKGVNIQSNPELAKQLMGQDYVNRMQGKYALAMDAIGKGIFGKGPNPDLYNQSTPQDLGFIGMAPSIKEAVAPTTSRPTMAEVAGDIDLNLTDLGNPLGDSRVVSEEMGLVGGIPDRGRGMTGPAVEMIGGQAVPVGDVLGRQMALEKADFYEAPKSGLDLGSVLSLAGLLSGSNLVKAAGMFANRDKIGRMAGNVRSGLGSLGTKVAGKMRGINPTTGRPNTQAEYERARTERQQQARTDRMIDRITSGKKTRSNPRDAGTTAKQKADISAAMRESRRGGQYSNDGGGGGGGKVVCTMMNERYGFGSFRNKIWMKFHESYGPEYQKGYHAIFLPLVKIAKGEGKINTAVRKVLEHMGRHVTADMFKIMKGKKRDPLGRIYRAIFEPTCRIIGKIKSALGRG